MNVEMTPTIATEIRELTSKISPKADNVTDADHHTRSVFDTVSELPFTPSVNDETKFEYPLLHTEA